VGLAKTPPLEVCEQQMPVLFEEYSLRPDSAGIGQWRGGLGVRYSVRLLRGEAQLSILGDRSKRGPFGVEGGGPASTTTVEMKLAGKRYVPPLMTKDEHVAFVGGDTITISTPGGGGYGAPKRRARADIDTDIERGYVTPAQARKSYGAAAAKPKRAKAAAAKAKGRRR
jgi:N-methylhydantoinase B